MIKITALDPVDADPCRYIITVDCTVGEPSILNVIFDGSTISARNCEAPSEPIHWTQLSIDSYRAEFCLCGVGPGDAEIEVGVISGDVPEYDRKGIYLQAKCPPCDQAMAEATTMAKVEAAAPAPAVKKAKPKAKPKPKPKA